jgi:hypothetical protein
MLRAWLLRLACDPQMDATVQGWLADIQRQVRLNLGDLGASLDWFEELVAGAVTPAARLAVYSISGLALAQSERIRIRLEKERVGQIARLRLWNRRERWRDLDRPVALGWAGASIGIFAIGWIVLLLFSSGVRFASPAEINQAWIFMAIALVLQACAELWLAAVIGGPYHPDYSLMTGVSRAAGRTGRTFVRRGTIGFLVIAAASAMLLTATIFVPFLLPLILVSAHAGWARARYQRWRADYARRRNRARGLIEPTPVPAGVPDSGAPGGDA